MNVTLFENLKQFVGFSGTDADLLRELAVPLEIHLPGIVESLFHEVQRDPAGRKVLASPAARAALRAALGAWLRGLFCGTYDADYFHQRAQIGRTHVRIGVPQYLTVAALEVLWQKLFQTVTAAGLTAAIAKLAALHKLLSIETALMLESYRESHMAEVRQIERDAVEDKLREAEKLAQVGQLAASLAHEIKNPLAGISGAIQVIRASLKPGDTHYPVLGEVLRQINRLDRSVKDLLVYARPRPPQYQRCDLSRAIDRVLTLLRKEPEFERVKFEYSVARHCPAIAADENQLEQLLLNLMMNAAQASTPGGLVRLTAVGNAAGVHLVVQDHGCGMSAEVLSRAFEPFFTTKARGTGLGLPICRKIAEAHGGTLSLRSTPGVGTEVTVELPEQPPAPAAGADE